MERMSFLIEAVEEGASSLGVSLPERLLCAELETMRSAALTVNELVKIGQKRPWPDSATRSAALRQLDVAIARVRAMAA
jgi:hypothetical protein